MYEINNSTYKMFRAFDLTQCLFLSDQVNKQWFWNITRMVHKWGNIAFTQLWLLASYGTQTTVSLPGHSPAFDPSLHFDLKCTQRQRMPIVSPLALFPRGCHIMSKHYVPPPKHVLFCNLRLLRGLFWQCSSSYTKCLDNNLMTDFVQTSWLSQDGLE